MPHILNLDTDRLLRTALRLERKGTSPVANAQANVQIIYTLVSGRLSVGDWLVVASLAGFGRLLAGGGALASHW